MRHCLIIEDDTENAQYVAAGLRELGWWVAVCRDGVDAVGRAVGEEWDAIILDRIRIPQISRARASIVASKPLGFSARWFIP